MTETVVLLAAGMSTRYGRLKQLEPVGPEGEALLDYAIFDARRAGFSRILLIIREELEGAFLAHQEGRWPKDLEVVFHHQRIDQLPGLPNLLGAPAASGGAGGEGRAAESAAHAALVESRKKPWGTAHALLTARPHLRGPFVVLNADDFYGSEAFFQAAEFFQGLEALHAEVPSIAEDPLPTLGLVTYTLADTLSDHGGVSRGICGVDAQGWLKGVQEVLEIRRDAEEFRGKTVSGRSTVLRGSESISTNFWLFTPAIFPILEAGFRNFLGRLRDAGPGESHGRRPEPEFLIPTVVNEALEAGKARIRGIPSHGRFLGITHPEDREWVVRGLEEMTKEGRYPRPLWK